MGAWPPGAKKYPPCEKYRRAGACIFAQCIKKVRRDGRLCPPAENPVFSKIYGEFVTSKRRKAASVPTVLLKFSRRFVGVDAHIDPAVQTDFTEIHGEFATFSGGDMGIAPYACLRDFRVSVGVQVSLKNQPAGSGVKRSASVLMLFANASGSRPAYCTTAQRSASTGASRR